MVMRVSGLEKGNFFVSCREIHSKGEEYQVKAIPENACCRAIETMGKLEMVHWAATQPRQWCESRRLSIRPRLPARLGAAIRERLELKKQPQTGNDVSHSTALIMKHRTFFACRSEKV